MDPSPLQKKYSHIYQNFISNKDQVISLPIINKWSSYLKHTENGIHIFSSSELRIYISFQKRINTHPGSILSFNSKKGRTQTKQQIIDHPKLKIDFLIETDTKVIDYRDELTIYIEEFIKSNKSNSNSNNNNNSKNIQQYKQESIIFGLLKQEEIGLSIIHKTEKNTVYKNLNNIVKPKENMRRQLLFSKNYTNTTQIKKKTSTGSTILKFIEETSKHKQQNKGKNKDKNKLNIFGEMNTSFKKQIQETKIYISHRLLTGFIHSIQEAGLHKIFQNFNKQQLLFSQIINFYSQIEHSVIQHNQNCFSVLIPRYIGKAAEQEFIKHIIQKEKACHLSTQKTTFQNQKGIQIEHNPRLGIYSKHNEIVLNTTENKIYIGGKKLSTKHIHSQTMTIELLLELMKQPGQLIHNKDLKPSTYSKNKNDMNSKIILPFKKIIQEKLGKKLQLNCMGQLHNFFIELNLDDISIASI